MDPLPSTPHRLECHLEVARSATAVDLLRGEAPLSGGRIKLAMTRGAVWLTRGGRTRRIRRAKRRLSVGDVLHLYYDERVLGLEPVAPVLVADERAYSVWSKPHGMLSQGSKWGDHCTVTRWAEQHLGRTAYPVHRLDRAAAGLIAVAHGKAAAAALSELFRRREVEKLYAARTLGQPPLDDLPHTIDVPLDGRDAITHVLALDDDPQSGHTRITVRIETGRKHQVRRHLAGLGTPIVGDRLYGSATGGDDLDLVAFRLAFRCPLSGAMRAYELAEAERLKRDSRGASHT